MKIKPQKSLGQNFLTDMDVIRKIIASANLQKEEVVLEIGPGKGVLTEALASKCRKVVAVEIDQNLIPVLRNRFKENKKIEIIHENILDADISQLITKTQDTSNKQIKNSKLKIQDFSDGYKLVANLPYYITSPIIRKFLESATPPEEMILMVQKEVAERITAQPGAMSILAVSVQYYATAEILFGVPRTAFAPVPEVDSAVIRIVPYPPRPSAEGRGWGEGLGDADKFFRIVRAGFCAKRKTLINNLANSFHLERKAVEAKLAQLGIAPNVRAQELSVAEWKKLAEIF